MRSRCVGLAVVAALAVALQAGSARADLNSELDNSIKGAVGCALLGANLTLIIEGAIGVRNPWLLSLIPIAVAGGGAAGGWFLGEASSEGAVATLVIGLALAVPAAVLVAWAHSYRPSRDEAQGWVDRTVEGAPGEDEGTGVEVLPPGTSTDVYGPEGERGIAPPDDEEGYDEDDGSGEGLGPEARTPRIPSHLSSIFGPAAPVHLSAGSLEADRSGPFTLRLELL